MAARDKLNGPGAAAEGARARNWTGALGAAGAYFLTGFLMSAARIAGSAAPFGAAPGPLSLSLAAITTPPLEKFT